jgi:hypothetical protein
MSEMHSGDYGPPGSGSAEESAAPRRDPRLLIGGGVAVAVVALAGGYFLLGRGGGSSDAWTPTAVPRHSVSASPAATVVPVGQAAAIKTFHGDVGRDPFQPLITTPPPATAAASSAAGTTAPTSGTPAATTTPGTVVGGPTATSIPTAAPTSPGTVVIPTVAPTTSSTVMIVLKAIEFKGQTPYALVSDAGKQYLMKTGDVANSDLKVMAIAPDDGTATFQLGDQMFDLHIGQSYVD